MCLTINKEFKTEKEAINYFGKPLIAEKDITVYKILIKDSKGRYKSPFRDFRFEKGYEYYQTSKTKYFSRDITWNWYYNRYSIKIHKGLHSFKSKNAAKLYYKGNDSIMVKMIIPKGSKYFIGFKNDIVSNRLIWY